jgi:hypothetical protein
MAAAAAGGGLLIAAAGAVPAYASAASAPARGHTITITAHPKTRGIGPHAILPCAKRPGTGIKPASCGDQTISCTITASTPTVVGGVPRAVIAGGETDCTSPVAEIDMSQVLAVPGGQVYTNADDPPNDTRATTGITTSCATGYYTNDEQAIITWPAGYVQTAGSNPIHQTVSRFVASSSCRSGSSGGGGGGGGGGFGRRY